MNEQLENKLKEFEATHGLKYLSGQREKLMSDLSRSLDFSNGQWRTRAGAKVEIDKVIRGKIESGNYVLSKPSVKETYVGPFSRRSDQVKNDQKKVTTIYLKKAIEKQNIHFRPGLADKAIDVISSHFLPHDDFTKGPSFSKVSDTEIGTLRGKEAYTLNELINEIGLHEWLDAEKSRIAQLQHNATLRQTATNMLPPGSSTGAIKSMADELNDFEARSLKVGYELPFYNNADTEFEKFFTLGGADYSKAQTNVRISVDNLDELHSIREVVRTTEIKTEPPQRFEGLTY